jgi:hypothetical protein
MYLNKLYPILPGRLNAVQQLKKAPSRVKVVVVVAEEEAVVDVEDSRVMVVDRAMVVVAAVAVSILS